MGLILRASEGCGVIDTTRTRTRSTLQPDRPPSMIAQGVLAQFGPADFYLGTGGGPVRCLKVDIELERPVAGKPGRQRQSKALGALGVGCLERGVRHNP